MDNTKRARLAAIVRERAYSDSGPRVLVSRSEFFDDNDDLGSIGCNLGNHPGTEAANPPAVPASHSLVHVWWD